jgi:hypothetical protein
MNRAVLSLCLFGAALATANVLIMQRPTCPSAGAKVVAAYNETSPGTVASRGTAKARAKKPANAPKGLTKTANAKPAAPNDLDRTGSVDQETQKPSEKSGLVSPSELADQQVKVDDDEHWAEVILAARVHSAASVSSPTVRYYRVGTRLKVIDRQSGWIKVIDPTTSKQGWIYEKYLMLKEGSDKKQIEGPSQSQKSAQLGSKVPDDPNLVAPVQPGSYVRPYNPRKNGWRRHYRYVWPPVGLAIRVYPGW